MGGDRPAAASQAVAKAKAKRPKRADTPVVPWPEVDRLLVHGEKVKLEGTEGHARRYPSFAELGERYGVSRTRIWQYASQHNCMERRKESAARELIRYDRIITERRAAARALGTQDVVEVVDDYIRGFKQAVSDGKVRMDSPGDLDRLVRLKELVTGGADSRSELQGGLTLEAIQARHRKLRGQVERMTAELAGTELRAAEPGGAGSGVVGADATSDGAPLAPQCELRDELDGEERVDDEVH
jgi:hypothetical protein